MNQNAHLKRIHIDNKASLDPFNQDFGANPAESGIEKMFDFEVHAAFFQHSWYFSNKKSHKGSEIFMCLAQQRLAGDTHPSSMSFRPACLRLPVRCTQTGARTGRREKSLFRPKEKSCFGHTQGSDQCSGIGNPYL